MWEATLDGDDRELTCWMMVLLLKELKLFRDFGCQQKRMDDQQCLKNPCHGPIYRSICIWRGLLLKPILVYFLDTGQYIFPILADIHYSQI